MQVHGLHVQPKNQLFSEKLFYQETLTDREVIMV